MDSIMFERFLDNLVNYLSVKEAYTKRAKAVYGMQAEEPWMADEMLIAETDAVDAQRAILQNIFETLLKQESNEDDSK